MKKTMFQTVIVLLALAVGLPLMAAETGQINYQARLLDSYGRRVNTTVDLSFKIYDAVTAGNLLWSETQAGVVVQDGVYSIVLGSQTAIPASVFAQNNIYLELGIGGETMIPRQQITASAYSLVARTVMGSNIYENQTSGYVGIGTTNPAVKLDVSGTVQATGIKMPTGAAAGYVLASDGSGVGTWQSVGIVITESDPIHTNWVRVSFAPATNDLWNAIGLRALQSDVTAATNDIWGGINARVLAATYSAATGDLWTAVNARLLKNGGVMTGPLTNELGFFGDGGGLTNISSSSVSLTGVVHRIGGVGSEMTGPLVVSNNVTVTLTNQAGYFVATNSIYLGGTTITNWNQVSSTADVAMISMVSNVAYGLNNQSSTWDTAAAKATYASNTATYASNIVIGLNNQSSTWDTAAAKATYASNIVVGLNSRSQTWNNAATIADGLNTRSNAWNNAIVITNNGPASVSISYSNLYYLGKDGSWSNACATNSTMAGGLLGLALGTAPATPATAGLLLNGHYTNAWGFTAGDIIYMSTNASQITKTRPTGTNHFVRIVGYAVNDSDIYFNPDRTYIEILGE